MRIWLAASIFAVFAGCAPRHNAPPAAAAAPAVEAVPPRTTRFGPGPQPRRMRVVPGRGACAPRAQNVAVLTACCNGVACAGQCVRGRRGRTECGCYDERGGCKDGLVCCRFRSGCVKPIECELP